MRNAALIKDIADDFLVKIKNNYFNQYRPKNIIQKMFGDSSNACVSEFVRIFDDVKIGESIREKFYDEMLKTKDPIHDLFVPVIDAIATRIMNADGTNLHNDIVNLFEDYSIIRNKFTNIAFHELMLRAIGSGCLANLSEQCITKNNILNQHSLNLYNNIKTLEYKNPGNQLIEEFEKTREDLSVKMENNSTFFANNLSLPIDIYLKEMNFKKFDQDLKYYHIFPTIMRLLDSILNLFLRHHDEDIKPKLNTLVSALASTMETFKDYTDFKEGIQSFSQRLNEILGEIDADLELQRPSQLIENKAKSSLREPCKVFSEKLKTFISTFQEISSEQKDLINKTINQLKACYKSAAPDDSESFNIQTYRR